MKEITFTVTDPLGIHARPAGILVKEAKKYASKITVWKGDKSCDMRWEWLLNRVTPSTFRLRVTTKKLAQQQSRNS